MPYHFPALLPNEMLYHGWARYLEQSNITDWANTLWELFGSTWRETTIPFHLEMHIEQFAVNLPPAIPYSSADYLLKHHTLFPVYSFPLLRKKAAILESGMKNNFGYWHKFHVFSYPNPYFPKFARYCIECAKQDLKIYKEIYWHRNHQIPGINVCTVHQCFLENSTFETTVNRNLRRVPKTARMFVDLAKKPKVLNSRTNYFQLLFSEYATDYLNSSLSIHYLEDVREMYKTTMIEKKFASKDNIFDHLTFRSHIYEIIDPLRLNKLIEEITGIKEVTKTRYQHVKTSFSPLLHLLTMYILGHSPLTLLNEKRKVSSQTVTNICTNTACNFNNPLLRTLQQSTKATKYYSIHPCGCQGQSLKYVY